MSENDKFRYYVIGATSSDENDELISHVAIELRPSAIIRLALANLASWVTRKATGWLGFHHIEVSFKQTIWLDWWSSGSSERNCVSEAAMSIATLTLAQASLPTVSNPYTFWGNVLEDPKLLARLLRKRVI